MSYLYRHIRLDTNEVFYIGISKNDNNKKYYRAYDKKRRSYFWKNIVNKTDYEIEIMLDDISYDEAKEKEKEFIKLYGRKDLGLGTLVNLTDGGESGSILKGDLNPMKKQENKDKVSKALKGRKVSEKTKKIQSDSAKNRNQIPPSRKGIKKSIESIEKMKKTALENNKTNGRRKPILQYDINMNFIKRWDFIGYIEIENVEVKVESIRNVCNGHKKSVYKFIWLYES